MLTDGTEPLCVVDVRAERRCHAVSFLNRQGHERARASMIDVMVPTAPGANICIFYVSHRCA
jgi:hypothetical protein